MACPRRRQFLATGAVLLGAASGCLGVLDDGADGSDEAPSTEQVSGEEGTTAPDEVEEEDGEIAWTHRAGDRLRPRSTVSGGSAYVGDRTGAVRALNVATGDEEWLLEVGDQVAAGPAVIDGTVYAAPKRGDLRAIDAATGDVAFTVTLPKGDTARNDNPTGAIDAIDADDDRVYVPVSNAMNLCAVDAGDGSVHWNVSRSGTFNPPTKFDDAVYATHIGQGAVAVDAASGEVLWEYETSDYFHGCKPAVTDQFVVVTTGADELIVLDRATGEERWRRPGANWRGVGVGDGIVVSNTEEGQGIAAHYLLTGDVVWRHRGIRGGAAPALVAGGAVYAQSELGQLKALDLETGTYRWDLDLPAQPYYEPATDGERLVVSLRDGYVAGIDA